MFNNSQGVMKMKVNKRLSTAITTLIDLKCVLPGKVREISVTCGTPGCKCMRKDKPEKHTARQMSYTHKNKTKALSVRKLDVLKVGNLNSNYKKLREATTVFAHEITEMVKAYGLEESEKVIEDSIYQLKRKSIGLKPESQHLRETRKSRDQWKARADNRKIELKSVKRKIDNFEQSRDNWKTKAMDRKNELKNLWKKVDESEKTIAKLKAEIDRKKTRDPEN